MSKKIIWYSGLNQYKKYTLDPEEKTFDTEIIDQPTSLDKNPLDRIIFENLSPIHKPLEILYSGGMDSEFILYCCVKHSIPVNAITMILKCDDIIINTHDLYYAEKFCRENKINQKFCTLNVKKFFENGDHESYLIPYAITQPHVATHFWLIDQCHHFPIIGGDWPWIQCHKNNNSISPWKIDYNSYDRYMQDRNIKGIGSMLSYSFDISCSISIEQIKSNHSNNGAFHDIHLLKRDLFPGIEVRMKSYGWELFPTQEFNIKQYRIDLLNKIGNLKSSIKWGDKLQAIIGSPSTFNDKFF